MMKQLNFLRKTISLLLLISMATAGFAQQPELRKQLKSMISGHKAIVGVSFLDLDNGDTVTINGNKHLPMQSVYKFHLALAVLHQVDLGKFKLEQLIPVSKKDLLPNTWSPLRDKYPDGDVKLPLSELLSFTVSQSDNNGCDILFRLLGGPARVNQYIHGLGIKDVAIKATEEEMDREYSVQFDNWSTAYSATRLLKLFYSKNILSKSSESFLLKVMLETSTGTDKIKGLLPEGTPVAHKTGSSGANKAGVIAASNDIGIVTLPNGKHFAVAVFVSMSTEPQKTTDHIIAEVTKAGWDYFLNKKY